MLKEHSTGYLLFKLAGLSRAVVWADWRAARTPRLTAKEERTTGEMIPKTRRTHHINHQIYPHGPPAVEEATIWTNGIRGAPYHTPLGRPEAISPPAINMWRDREAPAGAGIVRGDATLCSLAKPVQSFGALFLVVSAGKGPCDGIFWIAVGVISSLSMGKAKLLVAWERACRPRTVHSGFSCPQHKIMPGILAGASALWMPGTAQLRR